MYDMFYFYDIKKENRQFDSVKERFPLIKTIKYDNNRYEALSKARTFSTTQFFWIINLDTDYVINDNFNFDYVVPKWDNVYVHVWETSKKEFNSVYLIPKKYLFTKKEADYLFFVNKKEIAFEASKIEYDMLQLTVNDNIYETIASFKSTTSMFWVLAPDCKLLTSLTYVVPDHDKEYVHQWTPINHELPNLFLIPKNYPISKREADHLFFINKKQIDEKISKIEYDMLQLTVNDNIYETITSFKSTTSMFWVISPDCKLTKNLLYVVPHHDKEYVHQWTASNTDHLRLNLIPKKYTLIKREVENLFFVNKKLIDDYVCKEEYDIIFISYNEPNADKNWTDLLNRFPRAKRIHGIKGIHNAHIHAANIANTSMFWVVDGDSQIIEDFNLDFVVDPWDKDCVFVWKSKNPINNLIYGYGGVKLLPKILTLKLDTSTVDMTTSISDKFNPIKEISNITAFNTDPFNTWKSSFRECVKLSSKSINGQIDEETLERLDIWCTVGIDQPFGEYAIDGAIFGREYGLMYSTDKVMLSKINDWEWLTIEFNKRYNGTYK